MSKRSKVISFYKVGINYIDPAYGKEHVDYYAVSIDSFQAFADSVLDTYGSDCVVRIIDSFEFPLDRFFYRMLC